MHKVKASAVIPTMEYIMFKKGKEWYRRILKQLNTDQQQLFRKRMPAADWIDLDDFIDFNMAIVKEVYNGNINMLEVLGSESADYGMNTILKFFFRFGDVGFIVRKSTSIFSGYYQPARMIVVDSGDNYANLIIKNLADRDNILALRIKGYIRKIVELTGNDVVQLDLSPTEMNGDFKIDLRWQ